MFVGPLTLLTLLTFSEKVFVFNVLETVERERQTFHPLTFALFRSLCRPPFGVVPKVSAPHFEKPFIIKWLLSKASESERKVRGKVRGHHTINRLLSRGCLQR